MDPHAVGPTLPMLSRHASRRLAHATRSRALSSSSSHGALEPSHSIYVSESTDVLLNLSLEDWCTASSAAPPRRADPPAQRLFRRAPPNAPLLLLYRDAPAVVLGRNQSPWAEVNLRAARARAVPWVRRRSGGGAVFHVRPPASSCATCAEACEQDMGNTNFSLHLPRTAFDRAATGGLVLRALHALGLPGARLNDRHDLCVGPDKIRSSLVAAAAAAAR
jgi:lipoate-protein ligase A